MRVIREWNSDQAILLLTSGYKFPSFYRYCYNEFCLF